MHGAGTLLGNRYRLEERIGGGGMGEVWRGVDEVLGRTVAVKIMLPALLDEPGFAERFRGEARTMARLTHPGVVNVYDYSSDAQTAFLVMEYIDGAPLSRTLGQVGRLTAGRAMALIAQAADALQAAHTAGIVHRDVKPGNLMVRADGTLVLTDFGISRSELAGITASGMVLGTASYLSPEQAAGQVATAASDIYALGVVAYQCLAGRRPFEGDNPLEIAMRHVREEPPPLPADTPAEVREIVARALAKDPAQRWPSAATMAAAARQLATGLGATPVSPQPAMLSPTGVPPTGAVPSGLSPTGPVPSGLSPTGPVPPGVSPATQPGAQPDHATAPVLYHAATGTTAAIGGPQAQTGRPSALAVVAVILSAIAIVICAGITGYLARQVTDGQRSLGDLFSMITYDQPIEGSMTI